MQRLPGVIYRQPEDVQMKRKVVKSVTMEALGATRPLMGHSNEYPPLDQRINLRARNT
ncbi:hypothetical protein PM082_004053 [Marasmius tenuissimus]|nr:hypothetical protein PM082_004053 [Marasmius tenuissimus]